MKAKQKHIIGWREWVCFPDLGNVSIKAKIDTGARTSSLHAYDVRIVTRNGKKKTRFELHPIQDSKRGRVIVEAPLVEYRSVKSSSGHQEKRPVIMTQIKMMDQQWPVEITLTNRDLMGFRMLLGRQAIRDHFIIDAKKSYLTRTTK
jgi:hypothetical protein